MSETSVLHLASVDLLRECARQIRRMALVSQPVWLYGGIFGVDLHLSSGEIAGHDEWLLGVYTEGASVDNITDDLIHYAKAKGVVLET